MDWKLVAGYIVFSIIAYFTNSVDMLLAGTAYAVVCFVIVIYRLRQTETYLFSEDDTFVLEKFMLIVGFAYGLALSILFMERLPMLDAMSFGLIVMVVLICELYVMVISYGILAELVITHMKNK